LEVEVQMQRVEIGKGLENRVEIERFQRDPVAQNAVIEEDPLRDSVFTRQLDQVVQVADVDLGQRALQANVDSVFMQVDHDFANEIMLFVRHAAQLRQVVADVQIQPFLVIDDEVPQLVAVSAQEQAVGLELGPDPPAHAVAQQSRHLRVQRRFAAAEGDRLQAQVYGLVDRPGDQGRIESVGPHEPVGSVTVLAVEIALGNQSYVKIAQGRNRPGI